MNFVESALCYLKSELMDTGYFNRFYEYAERIDRGKESFPQVYTGNGQYKAIYDFDVNGSGYIRKNGSSQINIVTDSRHVVTSCDEISIVDVVMMYKLVAAVPKNKTNDNAFSDDHLALDLIRIIKGDFPMITNVSSTTSDTSGYSTDRDRVWQNEVRGIDKTIDLRLSFISIDFTLTFRTSVDCLNQTCDYA